MMDITIKRRGKKLQFFLNSLKDFNLFWSNANQVIGKIDRKICVLYSKL